MVLHSVLDAWQTEHAMGIAKEELNGGVSKLFVCFWNFVLQRWVYSDCGDGVVRIFRLDDTYGKSFKFERINLPAGGHPSLLAFAGDSSSIVVASQALSGSSLYIYREDKSKVIDEQMKHGKVPLSEKWEHHKVHDKRVIITLIGAKETYGSGDESKIVLSCSEESLSSKYQQSEKIRAPHVTGRMPFTIVQNEFEIMIANQKQYAEEGTEMNEQEIVAGVLGPANGYINGLGYGPKPPGESSIHLQQLLDETREELNESRSEAATFKSRVDTLTNQLNEQAYQVKEQAACIAEFMAFMKVGGHNADNSRDDSDSD